MKEFFIDFTEKLHPDSNTKQNTYHFKRHIVTRQNATFSTAIPLTRIDPTLVCISFLGM